MIIKSRSIVVTLILGACAYGLGLVIGGPAKEGWRNLRTSSRASAKPEITGRLAEQTNSAATQAPAAEISAFLSDPTNALRNAETMIRNWNRAGEWDYDAHQFLPLLFVLSSNDFPRVWSMVRDTRPKEMRENLQQILVRIWAERDPASAVRAMQGQPTASVRSPMGQALWAWGEKDPPAALAWIHHMTPGLQRDEAMGAMICGAAYHNPSTAGKLLAELPAGDAKGMAVWQVIPKLAASDPDAAAELLADALPGHRDILLSCIADGKVRLGVSNAVAWAQTLKNSGERENALSTIVSSLAETQPEQAAELAMAQPDVKLSALLAGAAAKSWAAKDAEGAAAWAQQLPDGSIRRQALKGLIEEIRSQEPEAAANFALNSVADAQTRAAVLQETARIWSSYPADTESTAESWGNQLLPGPDRDAFLSGACEGIARAEPERAANLAVSITPGKTQTDTLTQVLWSWVHSEGGAPDAAAWSTSLPAGAARTAALAKISEEWAFLDPTATGQWLESLPADDARAQAAEAFVNRTAQTHPELAAKWVDSIANLDTRNQQIEMIARTWLSTAPDTAQAWVQQSTLPDERKNRLLAK